MIRVRQIKVHIDDDNIENIKAKCRKKLRVKDIKKITIHDQSIDARHKPDIYFVYTVDVEVDNELEVLSKIKDNDVLKTPNEEYVFNITGRDSLNNRPVIVGAGPAGLFAAFLLAEHGYKPLVIERGKKVEERIHDVEKFWKTGVLNTESNVQFGEGGAGTFSDGKLTTQVKDKLNRKKKILDTFISCGADPKIGYVNKPHIGTDKLREIIANMRKCIISMGGEFRYNTCLTNIKQVNGYIKSIEVNNSEWIDTDVLVLALGHSARDTFKMLLDNNLKMSPKPFAVGIRIQHSQKMINLNQYGLESHPKLDAASYKLTYQTKSNRGVYSFCMCPGGFVVNASSEEGMLAVNGMSNNDRGSDNANSAIIVTVGPNDFGPSTMDGISFQRELERKAYELGKGNIPIQLYKDYKNNNVSTGFGKIKPVLKGNYTFANINELFPEYINESLKEGIDHFNGIIKGYNDGDSIIAGVESRTSSPIRMERDDNLNSNIIGIYPCGEGAGYAGGITSAGIDGIKVAEMIATKYKPFEE